MVRFYTRRDVSTLDEGRPEEDKCVRGTRDVIDRLLPPCSARSRTVVVELEVIFLGK